MEWEDYLKFVQKMTRPFKSVSDYGEENRKLLFDYSKEVFNEERNIFRDLENKAAKYLTVFTLLLAAAGFFANWLGIKVLYPRDWLDTTLLATGLTLLLTIFISWLIIFLVLGIGDFEELPLDQRTIDFFLKTPIQQVYKEVPDGLKEAMNKNAKTSKAKAKLLTWGHRLIILTWILLLSFCCLFIVYKGKNGQFGPEILTCNETWLESHRNNNPAYCLTFVASRFIERALPMGSKPSTQGASLCLKMRNPVPK